MGSLARRGAELLLPDLPGRDLRDGDLVDFPLALLLDRVHRINRGRALAAAAPAGDGVDDRGQGAHGSDDVERGMDESHTREGHRRGAMRGEHVRDVLGWGRVGRADCCLFMRSDLPGDFCYHK